VLHTTAPKPSILAAFKVASMGDVGALAIYYGNGAATNCKVVVHIVDCRAELVANLR
jgi:hypothetical protein